jgi:hypothetical protein
MTASWKLNRRQRTAIYRRTRIQPDRGRAVAPPLQRHCRHWQWQCHGAGNQIVMQRKIVQSSNSCIASSLANCLTMTDAPKCQAAHSSASQVSPFLDSAKLSVPVSVDSGMQMTDATRKPLDASGTCIQARSDPAARSMDVLAKFPPAFVRFLRENNVDPAIFVSIHGIPRYIRYACTEKWGCGGTALMHALACESNLTPGLLLHAFTHVCMFARIPLAAV